MRRTIKRILALWRPHRWLGIALMVAMLLQAVFTVVLALALKQIIDGVIEDDNTVEAGSVVLLLVAGYVVSAVAGVAAGYLQAAAGARILADVRTAAFDHLQRLSLGFHSRTQAGDLLARFSSDVAQLARGTVRKPLDGLKSLTALAFYLPVMFVLEWRLALLAVVLMPVAVYVVTKFGPDPDPALDEEKRLTADVLVEVNENLAAQPVIRAFGLGRRSRRRFGARMTRLRETSTRADFQVNLLATLAESSVALVQLCIIGAGAVLALNGELAAGTLAAFAALLTEFTWETTQIASDVLPEITKAGAGIRRIDALLAEEPAVLDPVTPRTVPQLTENIRFDEVAFSYDGDGAPQLQGLDLALPAGRYIGIVGPSGSGKSTLLSLILRFYEPDGGTVSIDGTNLADVAGEELRTEMGVVFQDTFLFDATVADNVGLAKPDATPEEIMEALDHAGLADFTASLPAGLDTMLGSQGLRLSGGQRQRIGIARALLRKPRLLLLDEVTAALDPTTEAAVNETLQAFRAGRTVISVTHRLGSVADADLIVVLGEGLVAEQGTFAALQQAGGVFAEMWEKQLGFTVSSDGRGAEVAPERLRLIPLFAALDDGQLEQLAGQLVSDHHDDGELIFRQGDPADRFFVIARGVVEVIATEGGADTVIAHLEDGDFFGEMALLDDAPRNATIRAVTPTVTLSLSRDDFGALLDTSAGAAESVRTIAASRAEAPRL